MIKSLTRGQERAAERADKLREEYQESRDPEVWAVLQDVLEREGLELCPECEGRGQIANLGAGYSIAVDPCHVCYSIGYTAKEQGQR